MVLQRIGTVTYLAACLDRLDLYALRMWPDGLPVLHKGRIDHDEVPPSTPH